MNKKLKVALFHCGFIYSGGGERIVLEESRGLIKRGYEVRVFAPTVDAKRCYPELLKELNVRHFLPSVIDRLPFRNALRMLASSFLAPLISFNFRDIDVFIGANQPGIWIAFCMATVLRKPFIVYLNQPNRIVYPRPIDVKYGWYTTNKDFHFLYSFLRLTRPILAFLDRVSITNAKRVLVNGGYIGEIIENVYSTRVIDAPAGAGSHAVIGSPFKGSVRVGGKSIKKPYLLITNRHDPQKRFDYVIRAFALVLKKFPGANLVIPGPFTEHSRVLVKLAKELKIEDKIYFTKSISEQELQKLYKNACVYCYPSPEEDFGLGPLEAGGWGVPTVAWKHAGPTVTVEDNVSGFLAKPYKVGDYANKILKLLKNKKLRKKMGKEALKRTKTKFSWEKHINILEETIKKVQ